MAVDINESNTILKQMPCADFELIGKSFVIHMKEDLDHHNCVFIREFTDEQLLKRNIKNIIFDFTNVDFMDSSGIGVIIGRYKRLKLMGNGTVVVTGMNERVNKILNMSGLYSLISKYKNIKEAIQELQ